ncbi:LysR family transcriptional regulator [Lederbergia wuyishanensis]|uniref:LysR family transcriptional repressor of citA n=1 Tax=Lederbergia wuyishanensis TaxID=1347903 RepID=A0ABU0D3Q3_9BACI|nr:LysR family transcriptional regulator [Lederbergia wuyishanensis]MDQ0343009.1 LysR family transcriptional repressor of citA [Lederbergia wuyishanensis]
MDIKWLKTFIIAAKYENFRKTSEELFLTQPAVTKHIKRLEENLNCLLFERSGKHITLTAAGHRFLPYAREIIATFEKGLEDFESWKQGYKRKLTIAAAPQIASSILPSLLRSFTEENPDIEVLINVLTSYEIGDEVSGGRADLGLTRVKPIQTNIDCQIIHEEPVLLVGPLISEDSEYGEIAAFRKYRLITHNHPDYWDDLLNNIKRYYPIVRTMKVNQIEITKQFIEQGLGISYLPATMVKNEVKMKKLLEIKPDKIVSPTSSTYVLTKVVTNESKEFIEFLKESILRY